LDRPTKNHWSTPGIRRQTQTLLCPCLAVCLLFVFLGRVMWLPFGKVTFAYYLNSSKFIWFS